LAGLQVVVRWGEVSHTLGKNANGSPMPRDATNALASIGLEAFASSEQMQLYGIMGNCMRIAPLPSSIIVPAERLNAARLVDECHSSFPYVPLVVDANRLLLRRSLPSRLQVW